MTPVWSGPGYNLATLVEPVHTKEYDMESAIMRLTGYSHLQHHKPLPPEFVHPEHTTPFQFIESSTLPVPEPLRPELYDYSIKRSYCTCEGIREITFESREYYQDAMICLGCGKVIRKNKSH